MNENKKEQKDLPQDITQEEEFIIELVDIVEEETPSVDPLMDQVKEEDLLEGVDPKELLPLWREIVEEEPFMQDLQFIDPEWEEKLLSKLEERIIPRIEEKIERVTMEAAERILMREIEKLKREIEVQ